MLTAMLPNPRVFRSRWSALFWAAGIIWLAIDVAGVGGGPKHAGATKTDATDATGAPVDENDTRNALNAFDSIG